MHTPGASTRYPNLPFDTAFKHHIIIASSWLTATIRPLLDVASEDAISKVGVNWKYIQLSEFQQLDYLIPIRRAASSIQWQTQQRGGEHALHHSYSCQNLTVKWDVSVTRATYNTTQHLADPSADLPGRFCAPVPSVEGTIQCCLPCPITDWVYSDGESYIRTEARRRNTEHVHRLRCHTESCQLAQCCGHGMLCVIAHNLPRSPSKEYQSTLPYNWTCHCSMPDAGMSSRVLVERIVD